MRVNHNELALIAILSRIVMETMDYSPVSRYDSESFLPAHLIEDAQRALNAYGARIEPDPEMMVHSCSA